MGRCDSPEEIWALLDRGGLVVDVRSTSEFAAGAIPGSLNLPLHLLPVLASERLPADRPLLVCCASGARSAMAVQHLVQMGYEAHDLGPWTFHPDLN
ncbi:MAG TPA: rhodanese-like domain-containing protein [Geothrix sp.]|nr:rhodanese-like domain-containing protein [Geothrix sp.]